MAAAFGVAAEETGWWGRVGIEIRTMTDGSVTVTVTVMVTELGKRSM